MNGDTDRPELSLVIPAYNEGSKIPRDLEALTGYLEGRGMPYEIIVVDDGSEDSTSTAVAGFAEGRENIVLLRNEKNRGKGFSVRRGVLASRGKYVAYLDAGLCVPPSGIDEALSHLRNGFDVALGSRGLSDSRIVRKQPWYRIAGSRLHAQIVWRIMGLSSIKDTQCGFKFFSRQAARDLFTGLKTEGFMFDIELLGKAARRGLRIKEFPVQWSNDPDTRFRPVAGSFRNLLELLRIKLS